LPNEIRPAIAALWNLDLAFADVVATSSDPRLGAIRLAWWRERLEQMDGGGDAPAEPRLQAVATDLLPRGVTGAELSQLEDGWLPLLEPFPWTDEQVEALRLRGRILFGIGARLLGGDADRLAGAGAFWALADGAGHCSDSASRQLLIEAATAELASVTTTVPRPLRCLTVVAALAAADLRGASAGGRLLAAVRHRLTGRLAP
jgi:phytoene synthase